MAKRLRRVCSHLGLRGSLPLARRSHSGIDHLVCHETKVRGRQMRLRKSTWTFIVWTALMILWGFCLSEATVDCTGLMPSDCRGITALVHLVPFFVWFVGAVPLSIVWYATRPR
jgi:hypothetical protein